MPFAKGPTWRRLAAEPKNLIGLRPETTRELRWHGMPRRRQDDAMYGFDMSCVDWWYRHHAGRVAS